MDTTGIDFSCCCVSFWLLPNDPALDKWQNDCYRVTGAYLYTAIVSGTFWAKQNKTFRIFQQGRTESRTTG